MVFINVVVVQVISSKFTKDGYELKVWANSFIKSLMFAHVCTKGPLFTVFHLSNHVRQVNINAFWVNWFNGGTVSAQMQQK